MQSEPLYRKIVHQAITRSWHHKHTWVFGFFATMLGFGGVFETISREFAKNINNLVVNLNPDAAGFAPFYALRHAFDDYAYPGAMLAIAIIFGLGFAIAFFWMAGTSVAALITTSRSLEEGKDLHLSEGIKAGSRKVFPVLFFALLGSLGTSLTIGLIFYILKTTLIEPSLPGAILYGLAFVLMTVIATYILSVTTFSTLYSVLRRQRLGQALAAGQRLFHKQWLLTLETAAVLFITTLGIGFLGIAATLAALLPVLFCFLLAISAGAGSTILFLIALTAFVFVTGIILTGSFISTYQAMAWTILFERATEGEAVAKFHRFEAWVRGLFRKR